MPPLDELNAMFEAALLKDLNLMADKKEIWPKERKTKARHLD
jgi:hypothetical protein